MRAVFHHREPGAKVGLACCFSSVFIVYDEVAEGKDYAQSHIPYTTKGPGSRITALDRSAIQDRPIS